MFYEVLKFDFALQEKKWGCQIEEDQICHKLNLGICWWNSVLDHFI